MINQSFTRMTLAIVLTCIPAVLNAMHNYTSIQERQNAIIEHYQALIQKWNPALDNPSDASLQIIIKQQKTALKMQYTNAFNYDDQQTYKTLLDNLNAWPVQFICAELDKDIQIIFHLMDDARILNIDSQIIDPTPFQILRAAIDTLPCMKREQDDQAHLTSNYRQFMAGLGILAAGYITWKLAEPYLFSVVPTSK